MEIAKIYGSADSPRFVNGTSGTLAERLKRQAMGSPGEEAVTLRVDLCSLGLDTSCYTTSVALVDSGGLVYDGRTPLEVSPAVATPV